jgi:hypothetical protein
MMARQLYHCRRARAIGNPNMFASIIIDAMDQVSGIKYDWRGASVHIYYVQTKTHVPYSSRERLSQKDVDSERLIQRIHGVIVHGVGSFLYLVEPDIVTKGSNQG